MSEKYFCCRRYHSVTAALLCLISSDYTVEEQPSEMVLIQELENGRARPLVFVLNANLLAMVKLVNCMFLSFISISLGKMHENGNIMCTDSANKSMQLWE